MTPAGEGDLEVILDFCLAGLLRGEEKESEETEEDEGEGDGKGLLFLLCFFLLLSRLDECDLECFFFFFLDLCRFLSLSLSLEEEEEERHDRRTRSGRVFPLLMRLLLLPSRTEWLNDYDVSERQSRKSENGS